MPISQIALSSSLPADGLLALQTRLRCALLSDRNVLPDAGARDLTAWLLLLAAEGEETVWQGALERLGEMLAVERLDGGYLPGGARTYQPGQFEWMREIGAVPSIAGVDVALNDPYVHRLNQTHLPLTCRDLRSEGVMRRALRQTLLDHGARAKMGMPLRVRGRVAGYLCADKISETRRDWTPRQFDLFALAGQKILPAILDGLRALRPKQSQDLDRLSPAERAVADLAGRGLSYKDIARRLSKSTHTVDHQIRAIRRKLEIPAYAKISAALAGID